jgi:hypothetical protein
MLEEIMGEDDAEQDIPPLKPGAPLRLYRRQDGPSIGGGNPQFGQSQRARGGAEAVTVSIPSRYVHTVNEMANRQDIARAITLLARFLEDAGSRSCGYDQ